MRRGGQVTRRKKWLYFSYSLDTDLGPITSLQLGMREARQRTVVTDAGL
jgi:hypothetical protein